METSNPYAAPNASLDFAPTGAENAAVRVGFWPRVGASIIDWIVEGLLALALMGLVAKLFPAYLADLTARTQAKMDPKLAAQMLPMMGIMTAFARWAAAVGVVALLYGLFEGLF